MDVLEYDADTGIFRWKHRRREYFTSDSTCAAWNARWPGRVAGSENGKGYVRIFVFGRRYLAHRLAWLMVHGEWPQEQIDHVNRIRSDNRIKNIRQATSQMNAQNKGVTSRSKSGVRGVCWVRGKRRWLANIMVDGKRHHLGYFESKDEAISERAQAELNLTSGRSV